MKLKFLGTRGYIQSKTRRHRMHSSLMVDHKGKSIMIDCGEDWLRKIHKLNPNAIILTHAHPDHAWGLKEGAPCPVYATLESWNEIKDYPIEDKYTVKTRKIFKICNISFEAFPVLHSKRCPAVGYRIIAGKKVIFYVPDVLSIIDRKQAFSNIELYIGDGSSIKRSLVRIIGDSLIRVGHAAISTQLGWCQKEGVTNAIFSHCGSEIVEGDERTLKSTINEIAHIRGVKAQIAFDGMEIHL